MLALGVVVLGEAVYKIFNPIMPSVETMGIVGGLALAANLVCFSLLYRFRTDNLNLNSTWLCSRNDLMANVGVLLAAVACYMLASHWPDIIVGVIIASIFLRSAVDVLWRATVALQETRFASGTPTQLSGAPTVDRAVQTSRESKCKPRILAPTKRKSS